MDRLGEIIADPDHPQHWPAVKFTLERLVPAKSETSVELRAGPLIPPEIWVGLEQRLAEYTRQREDPEAVVRRMEEQGHLMSGAEATDRAHLGHTVREGRETRKALAQNANPPHRIVDS